MTPEQIQELSNAIDAFIVKQAMEYKLPPKDISSIINARLFVFNKQFGNVKEYHDLIKEILELDFTQFEPSNDKTPVQ